jgi:sulfoxide reductase heme-binding subunit YedZ
MTAPSPTSTAPTGLPPRRVPELDPTHVGPARGSGTATVPDPEWMTAPFEPGIDRTGTGRPKPVLAAPKRTLVELGRLAVVLVGVLLVSWVIGRLTGTQGRTLVHNKMLPWILGRGLGVAAYVSLTALVVLGLWLRHPWRARFRRPSPATILWAHVALAACTITLVAGHLTALALDKYAGVGWSGAFVPWGASFKTTGVALGTIGLYGLVLVIGTASLAGSIGRAAWFPIHSVSVLVFCVCLAHGVMSGSDGATLRWVYVASGVVVVVLQFTRWLVGTLARGPELLVE